MLGNALQQTLAYDKAGRLSSQRLMGATQWSRQYQYDAAGQLTGIADNRSGQLNYRYDPVGRLLEAATPKGVESFRFDPAGNLLDNAPAADGHQDDSLLGNLLSQYAGRHYRYDSRGNLVEKRVNGSLTQLEWDSHNRLSRLTAPDGQRTDYHYDPLGRRIAKISQGQATLYGWDGDVLAFETRDEEAVHYLFEPDSFVPLAQVHTDAIRGVKVPAWSQHNPYDPDKDPLRQAGPEPQEPKAVYYYHTDHLGTPQALTDEHGALALEMDYQAWGQAREVIADAASKAGIRNPFRFQGQYHDDESGLHYNRYRYYDPEIGRFISRDPIGLHGGINTHAYAPNPTLWIDPTGLTRKSCPDALDEAQKAAERIRNNGGRLPTATCAVVNRRTGKVYTGTSGVKPTNIDARLASTLPKTSLEPWPTNNCAEVDAMNQALKDGSSRSDLDMATVRTKDGSAMPCCSNCSVTFKYDKVKTGKKQ
ncbi:sugar-binding protein [Chromobacterium phragmitis]|uniref:RHS repeat-associated core domain-containing protein n=1 Tax=Chromobacterium phragmitis TaxID=2202141 RepID=UPI000DED2D02|nr:RHS repeat-associated core domain-containing protein [Chromobacterium phragmitis]AXE31031.1 sugar-binding protein [Chromobacterium phragmitis]